MGALGYNSMTDVFQSGTRYADEEFEHSCPSCSYRLSDAYLGALRGSKTQSKLALSELIIRFYLN